jgi:hypothetical protein
MTMNGPSYDDRAVSANTAGMMDAGCANGGVRLGTQACQNDRRNSNDKKAFHPILLRAWLGLGLFPLSA